MVCQLARKLSKALRREIYNTQIELAKCFPEKPDETADILEEIDYSNKLVDAVGDKTHTAHAQKLIARIKELLEDDKIRKIQSQNDEDATIGHKSKDDSFFGYKNHLAMTEDLLITGISVTTGRTADTKELSNLVEKAKQNGVIVEEVIGDKTYSSTDNLDYCNENNIKLISRTNHLVSSGKSRDDEFVFNKDANTMQCPEGHLATRCDISKGLYDNKYYNFFFNLEKCRKCQRNGTCYKGTRKKSYQITVKGEKRGKQFEFENSDYFKERI